MSKAKTSTPVQTQASKRGQNRDAQATMKLSLKLGFARNARLNPPTE